MKPSWDDVELLIVGAGTMGASLAQTYAQSGFTVGLLDISDDILRRALQRIDDELEKAKERIFSPADTAAIRRRILVGTSYEEACSGKTLKLVIEAATESIDIKRKIFICLDSLTPPSVILATNSSSLNTNILAQATKRPDKVVWMHYFYLPHKNRAAEYAGTDTASQESKSIARKYLRLGGKIPTYIRGSRKGGVADIIFVALLNEATRMLDGRYEIADVEAAGRRAFGAPLGFLQLMDETGLPIGLYSMESFSDSFDASDPLFKVYGNFFTPPQNYVDLVEQYNHASDKSSIRWIRDCSDTSTISDPEAVERLVRRFHAISFLAATESVDSALITIEDLEALTQNAFLWKKGPFTLMEEFGPKYVRDVVEERAAIASSQGQDFPVCDLLKRQMREKAPWTFHLSPVYTERELDGTVRRIVLSNPRAANAMDNTVFEELKRQFIEANEDEQCKAIIFDTAPIKTFIAGAHVPSFIERIRAKDFDAILRDTRDWQHTIFHVMTGTPKPKIAIVDGQAFGGGVEVACAFALDPNSLVLITNRTSFSLPETRLGIYPGLRGTLTLSQLILHQTGDPERALALARYYIVAGGTGTSSPQVIYHLGCADAIVPQHRRDDAADLIARAIMENNGRQISQQRLAELEFERLDTRLSFEDARDLQIATELFSQSDLLPTIYAQARGHLPLFYSAEMKAMAERVVRRVANNSPNAVWIANYLVSRGFEGFQNGVDNDSLAEFELQHYLRQVFEHPDALIGLEAMIQGRFPIFRRRYPF